MAVRNININFNDNYEVESISEDLRESVFTTTLENGMQVPLHVEISDVAHGLLPNVYNLAFGPRKNNGVIDDKIELQHANYSKVFSTILFHAFAYLQNNPEHSIGIDGSDNVRAFLYYLTLQRNYDYLSQRFEILGLKYYVRITRFGKNQYDNPFDFDDIIPEPVQIEKGVAIKHELLYNYFIFKLKN